MANKPLIGSPCHADANGNTPSNCPHRSWRDHRRYGHGPRYLDVRHGAASAWINANGYVSSPDPPSASLCSPHPFRTDSHDSLRPSRWDGSAASVSRSLCSPRRWWIDSFSIFTRWLSTCSRCRLGLQWACRPHCTYRWRPLMANQSLTGRP